MRTGASAAVSAKWLARKNAKKLAIVGAGHMAEGTLATCDTVFAWDEVRIWSRSQATLDEFVKDQAPKYRFPIHASRDLAEVVRGTDVVVTVTPAREPLVKDEWIAPGTHVCAVGADRERLGSPTRASCSARIFVDDIRQRRDPDDGEINVPLSKGSYPEQDDIAAQKSAKSSPAEAGRRSDDEITLFDSNGIALRIATFRSNDERAVAAGAVSK
jgi:alanine dehydrogenase